MVKLSQIVPVSDRYRRALVKRLRVPAAKKQKIASACEAAFSKRRFLVAIWSVEKGNLHMDVHTHDFPTTKFSEVIEKLKDARQ